MSMLSKTLIGIIAAVLASLIGAGIISGIGSTAALGQRVAVVETHYQDLQRGQERIEKAIDSLESKLDRALQRPR